MRKQVVFNPAVAQAVYALGHGGIMRVAEHCNERHQTVQAWMARGHVPPLKVAEFCVITGAPLSKISPAVAKLFKQLKSLNGHAE